MKELKDAMAVRADTPHHRHMADVGADLLVAARDLELDFRYGMVDVAAAVNKFDLLEAVAEPVTTALVAEPVAEDCACPTCRRADTVPCPCGAHARVIARAPLDGGNRTRMLATAACSSCRRNWREAVIVEWW